MGKPKKSVRFIIPPYSSNRADWRRLVNKTAFKAMQSAGVKYLPSDKIEIWIQLCLPLTQFKKMDVDNMAKIAIDALQGLRLGDNRKSRSLHVIIPNDNQIHRLIVEKYDTLIESGGEIKIRKFGGYRLSTRVGKKVR